MCPDHRQHRGAHPADEHLFSPAQLERLRQAVSDLSWLLGRGYATAAALKLTGDRYHLTQRQRLAVARAACTDAQKKQRQHSCLPLAQISARTLLIDGFNLIITIEAALSGGVLLRCRDECIRDLSSVHGSYRSVAETERAILLAGETLMEMNPQAVTWLLDQPVSNSGRLAQQIRELAQARGWPWQVEVVMNPDRTIVTSGLIAVSSDSMILDGAAHWINFNRTLIDRHLPQAWIIDLRD
ncbi:MAG: DUF434 domain-containing protein [Blastocatellia bacterium]